MPLVALLCTAATPRVALAASTVRWSPYDLPRLQQTTLKSATGASYRIVVASPAGPAPAAGYPVIYVVDGNAWTSLVSEIIRINIGVGMQSSVEPAVVVGIGYPANGAFDLTRRKFDLTSPVPPIYRDHDIGTDPVGGDVALMDFIDRSVKPTVQARFTIDRARQTLLGHSLGGLFALRTMFDRPRSFQTYVALSPSIWWNHRALLAEAQRFIRNTNRPKALRVFLSVGDLEEHPTAAFIALERDMLRVNTKSDAEAETQLGELQATSKKQMMVTNVRRLAALFEAAHIATTFVDFPGEDHFSVVPAALGRAVPFALRRP